VVVLPALVAIVSLAGAFLIGRDAWRRASPDKVAWVVAFVLFSLAAAAEVVGSLGGWSPALVRVYYVSGAMLVVGFLGLGELYLLASSWVTRAGPGIALFMVAVAAALVAEAPVDPARLGQEGWHALERGPVLVAVTITINTMGTAIVAGGAAYSAWHFWRRRIFRHRMIGCLLIALGTLIVAAGGTLTRLGRPEYLYVAMLTGVSVIFVGYLEARRREIPAARAAVSSASVNVTPETPARPAHQGSNGHARHDLDPAIEFLVALLALESATEIEQRCRFWSVDAGAAPHLSRDQAHRVWAIRLRLPPVSRERLDRRSAAAQAQIADLYHEVLAPGVTALHADRQNFLKSPPR